MVQRSDRLTRYVVGMDGGGSKIVGQDEVVYGRGWGGPSNYLKEGVYLAKIALRSALTQAVREARRPQQALYFGTGRP